MRRCGAAAVAGAGSSPANYLETDVGIENPTSSRNPIHDHTNQAKGFGDISYLIDDDTRLSFMFGATNNRFEIPNNPDQTPQFGYLDTVDFDSAQLDERQRETTRFGVLSLQGKIGAHRLPGVGRPALQQPSTTRPTRSAT